jgi:hypothetical protein
MRTLKNINALGNTYKTEGRIQLLNNQTHTVGVQLMAPASGNFKKVHSIKFQKTTMKNVQLN